MLRGKYLPAPNREISIAVLPFDNLSESKEDEFFSDGMTEDVIAQLSKIGRLKVISRTSIMGFKGTNRSLREVGKELEVSVILEGSIRRSENRVRIVAQLIDAASDHHIWAETYDREMEDIFEIQSDVAKKIAEALKTKLTQTEQRLIEKKPTVNIAAYELYLKGRENLFRDKNSVEQAILYFKKAIDLDANFALAFDEIRSFKRYRQ